MGYDATIKTLVGYLHFKTIRFTFKIHKNNLATLVSTRLINTHELFDRLCELSYAIRSTGMSRSDFVDFYRGYFNIYSFYFLTFTQLKTMFTYYSHLDQGSANSGQWAKPVPVLVLSHFQMAEQISKGYFTM